MYFILKGMITDLKIIKNTQRKNYIHLSHLREAGFGCGLGDWSKEHLVKMVVALSKLKFNLNLAVYSGGILGYLNYVVKKPITQIEARMQMYLFKQYEVLKLRYDSLYLVKEKILGDLQIKKKTEEEIGIVMQEYFVVNKEDKEIVILFQQTC